MKTTDLAGHVKTIYLAGGLFNVAERERNKRLAITLERLNHHVILPQERALQFFNSQTNKFDVVAIVEDCRAICSRNDLFCVFCADGPDVDSGTAVEYGIAISHAGMAIVYRTDFRTAPDREVGLNAMFTAKGTRFIYMPCFAATPEEFDQFYTELARRISELLH